MASPFNIRWGIMATGWIAEEFVHDLLIDSSLRGAGDISHTVVAVASSSSITKAEEFITRYKIPSPCAAYGSYEELVKDPNVDVVYIATPHSHHFQNTMLALEAGKHVLCEKPFTVNVKQAEILVETAKRKKLFLMEAVWTRFFPVSVQIREAIRQGEIGDVVRVIADTSAGAGDDVEKRWGVKHRMVNMDLAGGALLDLGIYSLTWVFQALYHTLPISERQPPSSINAHVIKYPQTGADESTSVILEFPRSTPSGKYKAHGVALTSLRVNVNPDGKFSAGPAIRIQGTKGEIQVIGHAYHPDGFRIIPRKIPGEPEKPIREVLGEFPGNGKGMYWEADEVARCVRDGKLESNTMSWEETLVIMRVMDEVRRQNGLVYPEKIESTKYPLKL
ncbi:hypothetical protein VTO42DRAFT_8349 [Malbranchea cinnamomea]